MELSADDLIELAFLETARSIASIAELVSCKCHMVLRDCVCTRKQFPDT